MATDYGTFYWPAGRSGGGSSGKAQASGIANISNAASSVSVSYSSTITSTLPPVFSFVNAVDATPIFLIGYVSAFSTTGFTVIFNAPADSANYKLVYAVFGAL